MNLDANLCHTLLDHVLPGLTLLDPACGSGAFLVAAMKCLITIYSAVTGKIDYLTDKGLTDRLATIRRDHPSLHYYIKKRIILDNLYGVDLMEESTEIARLRLFLALVASAQTVDQLEPLPNIDFNILAGNSLIGLMHVDEAAFNKGAAQTELFDDEYRHLVDTRNRKIATYRDTATYHEDLREMRDEIEDLKAAAYNRMNLILLDEFGKLGIKYEQATWDDAKGKEGKPVRRPLKTTDIEALHPFHWGYEFDTVLNQRGGFDAIITNPPWETFKPQAKEFFQERSDLVTKNTMTIKEFEAHQQEALKDSKVKDAWLQYLSRFPHVSAWYRNAKQYENQISVVNGKKAGTDINLYKLFTEQCFNLLRLNGQCGIVIPSGIYTDLGTKQIRELLFGQTTITGLFGFENRKTIFENVDSRFKFVALTYGKGGHTESFPAAFMRHEVSELASFPRKGSIPVSVEMVRRLSPDSLSIMEFKSELDVRIAEKMLQFPLLGERIEDAWNLSLTREFDMTNDSHLFKTSPGPGRVPLYEGKMIHHYTHQWGEPKWWIDEIEGRNNLSGRSGDRGKHMGYQGLRIGIRAIARNTDERTLITGPIPANSFCGNSVLVQTTCIGVDPSWTVQAFVCVQALLNSFAVDYFLRQTVTANVNMFYIYQLRVPRISTSDLVSATIFLLAARLICTTPEFDELAREVGLRGHEDGVTDPAERAKIRAELDGMVAHLYGLTEEEFAHVLSTFPLVPQAVRDAALEEYRRQTPPLLGAGGPDPLAAETRRFVLAGENDTVEFKRTLEYVDPADPKYAPIPEPQRNQKIVEDRKGVLHSALKTICAYLNSPPGGTLLIGVHNDKYAVGLTQDFASVKDKNEDGFELKLRKLIRDRFQPHPLAIVRVRFPVIDGTMVCRVDMTPDGEIYHLDGEVYVRNGNETIQLKGPDLTRWIRTRAIPPP